MRLIVGRRHDIRALGVDILETDYSAGLEAGLDAIANSTADYRAAVGQCSGYRNKGGCTFMTPDANGKTLTS